MAPEQPVTTDEILTALPLHLQDVLAKAPANVGKRDGADLVTRHIFPVSHRSLEVWPLQWRYVNGRAITSTAALFAVAYAKLEAAPTQLVRRRRTDHVEHAAA